MLGKSSKNLHVKTGQARYSENADPVWQIAGFETWGAQCFKKGSGKRCPVPPPVLLNNISPKNSLPMILFVILPFENHIRSEQKVLIKGVCYAFGELEKL